MKVRIATWNMAYWSHKEYLEEAWGHFLNELDVDIFFFQEARPPKTISRQNLIWHNAGKSAGRKDWGTGIYSKKYKLSEEPKESIPESSRQLFKELCVVANTKIEGVKLTLISVYGRFDKIGNGPIHSIPNLHRVLSDLTSILNGDVNGKRNIVLGGDLNASLQFDDKWGGTSNKIFFDRVNGFELNDCFKLQGHKDFIQTLRQRGSEYKWQNDYIFVSKSLSRKFVDCEVVDTPEVRKYSDHNIVISTLNLGVI